MPAPSHFITKEKRHKKEKREEKNGRDKPHTIDVIGNGVETTICGHIDLLYLLPIHNAMHRKLLDTFRKKPGNYEGKFNVGGESQANVVDYGKGYLAIHFKNDITRPEMSDFLLSHDWKMMNANCTTQDGKDIIFEKWTNVRKSMTSEKPIERSHTMRAYY